MSMKGSLQKIVVNTVNTTPVYNLEKSLRFFLEIVDASGWDVEDQILMLEAGYGFKPESDNVIAELVNELLN